MSGSARTDNSDSLRIACISSSLSPISQSRKLVKSIQEELKARGQEATIIDLRDYPHWLFVDADDESLPAPYMRLRDHLESTDAVIIGTPVYLYSVSGATKNLIDIVGGSFTRKPVAFVSAAGSCRSHLALREVMTSLMFEYQSYMFPQTVQLFSGNALTEDMQFRVKGFCEHFINFSQRLKGLHMEVITKLEEE